MAQQLVKDNIWRPRIESALRYKKEWSDKFKCDILEDYYEGFQWKNVQNEKYQPYTINRFFETIEIKQDQFISTFPRYTITPRVGNSNYDMDIAVTSANLKQDVLNTVVFDEREQFVNELRQAYKESFFRFGVFEVGYSADWVYNPNVPKPLLNVDKDSTVTQKPKVSREPEEIPVTERVYFKHISAKNFIVGGIDHKYLHRCTWYGYCEWVNKSDLLSIPKLMNRDKLDMAETVQGNMETSDNESMDRKPGDAVKVWHIWDNKSKQRILLLDAPMITLFQQKFTRQTVFDYRPIMRTKTGGFYPIPPAFNWLSPQNELNETREQLRNHRKRFVRKYQARRSSILDEEMEKFETGGDGTIIIVEQEGAIKAIENPSLGPELDKQAVNSSQDLNEISGTSANIRGVSDRTTATESNYINQRATIRENSERDRVVNWMIQIGRSALLTVQEKFVLGVWAMLTSDGGENLFGEVQENLPAYQWVTSEDLKDGYDFRIDVDVTTLSVASQELEKRHFLEFIAVVSQYPAIAMSPTLIREAALRVGYKNEKVIKEMQNMALLQQLGTMSGIQQAQGNNAQQTVAGATPNSMEQIRQQLQGQVQ